MSVKDIRMVKQAGVAKLVDAHALGACQVTGGGSSPLPGTHVQKSPFMRTFLYVCAGERAISESSPAHHLPTKPIVTGRINRVDGLTEAQLSKGLIQLLTISAK